MIFSAYSEIAEFGARLDSRLSGEAYLASRQKQLLDKYGANILRVALSPIAMIAKMAVWAEDGSPTTLDLERVGKEETVFNQHKIRSMEKGTENKLILVKDPEDSRITKVGHFIRCYSIDELPQLNNVINGEMSLIGPRPITRPEFDFYCQYDTDFQAAYTSTLPGMTGLEQVNGRGSLKVQDRIDFIKQYADEACLALDIDILRKTATTVISKDGAY